MSLYNDLTTVLTPYANKIKQNESDIGDIKVDLTNSDRYIARRYYAESGTFNVNNVESADPTRCRTDVVNVTKVKKVIINIPSTLGIVSGTVLINGEWVSSSGHILNYSGYSIVDDNVDAFRLCYRHKNNDGQALTSDEINGVYLYQYIDIYEKLDNLDAQKINLNDAKSLINTGLLQPDIQIIDRYNDANVTDATRVFSGTVTYENDYLQWVTPSSEVSSAFSIALYGTTATMVAEYVPDSNVASKLTVEFDYDFDGTGAKCYCSDYNNATKVANLESGSDKHAKLVFDVTSVKTFSISLSDKANNLSKTLKIKNLLLYYGTSSVQLETSETQTAPYTKMLSIGDSLTNGCLWQSYAARVIGVQRYTRTGGSGGTVSTAGTLPIYNAVQALTSDLGYDLITFWGGTNDWSQSIELGTFDDNIDANERDTATFYGALIGCIEKLTTLYPTARIVMIGTTPRASNNGVATYHNSRNSRNLYLSDYVDAVKTVADYFGCPFLDLLNTSGINDVNISSWMQAQNNGQGQIYYLHFNNWATEKIGRRVGAFIKSLGY